MRIRGEMYLWVIPQSFLGETIPSIALAVSGDQNYLAPVDWKKFSDPVK